MGTCRCQREPDANGVTPIPGNGTVNGRAGTTANRTTNGRDELGWEFIQTTGSLKHAAVDHESPPSSTTYARRSGRKLSRAGAPALGVEVRISPDGEVLARGNHIMGGYWSQPEATADAIRPASDDLEGLSWFHTGDGGSIDDDCYVTIIDRKKDVIISGGENVSSIEVEDAIFSHPDVAEVAVIGVPDEKWGEMVMALVVTSPGSALTEADLIAYTRTKLAGFKCPKSVEFRDVLARTATGKLQKFKLREPYWASQTKQVN